MAREKKGFGMLAQNLPGVARNSEVARNLLGIHLENGPDQPCVELSTLGIVPKLSSLSAVFTQVGVSGSRGLFRKVHFAGDSRDFRDSSDSIKSSACDNKKTRRIRPFHGCTPYNTTLLGRVLRRFFLVQDKKKHHEPRNGKIHQASWGGRTPLYNRLFPHNRNCL